MTPVRVLVVSEIPTPYRLPLFRMLAERPEIDLEVLFCAAEQPDRPWRLEDELAGVPHRVLPGRALTFRTSRNTFVYELNPEIVRHLGRGRVDALVVGGYAVFAEQAAIALARARRIPYLIHSESHSLSPRPLLKRALKHHFVSSVVEHAAAGLAVGSAAADYLAAYGLAPGRIRIVPNTIDVHAYAAAAADARGRAGALRSELALPARYQLFVGRLVEVKGVYDLLEARRLAALPDLVVAGTGPLEDRLRGEPGIHMLGFQPPERLIQLYALAETVVVPSRFEPWGVVVNEALACGAPVIATDAVGAAQDLVRSGRDGWVVPAGDSAALAEALARPPLDRPRGGRIERWTYDFGVEQFLDALRIALPGRIATTAAETLR